MNEIYISVVMIDGRFREKFHTIDFFARQTFPRERMELIWVEYQDSILPELAAKLEKEPGFRSICLGESGTYHSSFCFNRGIREARGKLLVIPDGDVVVEPHFLTELWEYHTAHPGIAAYIHRFDEPQEIHREPIELEHLQRFCVLTNPQNYGGCLSVARQTLIDINGYEEHAIFSSGFHANGLDVYTRLKNYGIPVAWHPSLRLFHPWHPKTGHGHPFWKAQGLITQEHATQKTFLPYRGLDPSLNSDPPLWLIEKIEAKFAELANPKLDTSPLSQRAPLAKTSASMPKTDQLVFLRLLLGAAALGFLALSAQFATSAQASFPLFSLLVLGLGGISLLAWCVRQMRGLENAVRDCQAAAVAQAEQASVAKRRLESLMQAQAFAREQFRLLTLTLQDFRKNFWEQQKDLERRYTIKTEQYWELWKSSNQQTHTRLGQLERQWETSVTLASKLSEQFKQAESTFSGQLTKSHQSLVDAFETGFQEIKALSANSLEGQMVSLRSEINQQSEELGKALLLKWKASDQSIHQDLHQSLREQSERLETFRKNFWHQLQNLPTSRAPSVSPYQPSRQDILLVSYPGAGMGVLRRLLVELMYGYSTQSPNDLDFFIPDYHASGPIRVVNSDFHFVKCHSPYFSTDRGLNRFERVIYLERDLQNTLCAQYAYLKDHQRLTQSPADYLKSVEAGLIWPGSPAVHQEHWVQGRNPYIVHYEALVANPRKVFIDLFTHLDIAISERHWPLALERFKDPNHRREWITMAEPTDDAVAAEFARRVPLNSPLEAH